MPVALAVHGAASLLNGLGDSGQIEEVRSAVERAHGVRAIHAGADMAKADAVRDPVAGIPAVVVGRMQRLVYAQARLERALSVTATSARRASARTTPPARGRTESLILDLPHAFSRACREELRLVRAQAAGGGWGGRSGFAWFAIAAGPCSAVVCDRARAARSGGRRMASGFVEELLQRLDRYVRIDTQSDASSATSPSTSKQHDLLNLLVAELTELGVEDVRLTDYGAVLATIPATVATYAPTMALLAHVDTTPQFTGAGVRPIVHRDWQGGDIVLPDDPQMVLRPAELPYLATKVGDDIVTASGTTLLGADDKAGVAIVMATARHLMRHPDIPHGPVRICFTPDEEIGRGVHADLPRDLGASVAYTLDGAQRGEIVHETFSADGAVVKVQGVAIHPGWAKGRLVNALHLAAKIIDTLPQATLTPETTDGRQGFIHVTDLSGSAASAELHLILRDFEAESLRAHGELLRQVCAAIQATEPRARIECAITPQYRNMRYWLENDMRPVELARAACRRIGVEPFSTPIRGGTDGSRLTELGVPTPNLFTGMQEIHGPLEWISLQDMARATQLCVELVQLWGRASEPTATDRPVGEAHALAEAQSLTDTNRPSC